MHFDNAFSLALTLLQIPNLVHQLLVHGLQSVHILFEICIFLLHLPFLRLRPFYFSFPVRSGLSILFAMFYIYTTSLDIRYSSISCR